jgi:hypothetical protein
MISEVLKAANISILNLWVVTPRVLAGTNFSAEYAASMLRAEDLGNISFATYTQPYMLVVQQQRTLNLLAIASEFVSVAVFLGLIINMQENISYKMCG